MPSRCPAVPGMAPKDNAATRRPVGVRSAARLSQLAGFDRGRSVVSVRSRTPVALSVVVCLSGSLACSAAEPPLGSEPTVDAGGTLPSNGDASAPSAVPSDQAGQESDAGNESQGASSELPGEPFVFELADSVYIDLAVPAVVQNADRSRSNWDLHFDGLEVYTNSGAAGPGEGASFGPTSELELLFDTAPDVPMRADLSDGAMSNWYWFANNGIISRFRAYGVRDGSGRLFKLQVVSYYGQTGSESESGIYSIRFAEVTETGNGEIVQLSGIDARAGGVSIPAGAAAGCVDLARGEQYLLNKEEWLERGDWHLCFQRTEIFVNGGLSGPGQVAVVDLEQDPAASSPDPVSSDEAMRTAESDLQRFERIGYAELSQSNLPWQREYRVQPRIGDNWLSEDRQTPIPGSWIVRGADGLRHYALFFTALDSEVGRERNVAVQIKTLE